MILYFLINFIIYYFTNFPVLVYIFTHTNIHTHFYSTHQQRLIQDSSTMIMTTIPVKNRLKLIIPQPPKGGRILKTCTRCRRHKTKCDAQDTNPYPCSHCFKRNLDCTLETISKTGGKITSLDVVERLSIQVTDLKEVLDNIINRRNQMVELLIQRGKLLENFDDDINSTTTSIPEPPKLDSPKVYTPQVAEIQSCISTPALSPEVFPSKADFESPASNSKFITVCNKQFKAVTLTHKQALKHFTNYENNFNHYLPIFPHEFFTSLDLVAFHKENELLFWCIMLTSLLNQKQMYHEYQCLAEHVKYLVVKKCWLNTPRSVYVISSLLILTTWPLPNYKNNIEDNISVKFISTMKSLSYQFGLHKLEFINEFSHKTKMNLSQEINSNNLIRERIYKFVNVVSNYWMINLGISNNNYNGFTQDYIINKASNIDIYKMDEFDEPDQYINCMLKISMIQSKLNENMNNLIGDSNESILLLPNQANTSKLINFNMFEIIINDLNKLKLENIDSIHKDLIDISIYYSKLQLFIYSMSYSEISFTEYQIYLSKLLKVCFQIIELIDSIPNFNLQQMPIFYKFPIELTILTLLRIFKSPVLNTVEDYKIIKNNGFAKLFKLLFKDNNWKFVNIKIWKIIEKFNQLDNMFILGNQGNSFFLIDKMKNYLVGSLNYELIWLIYKNQRNSTQTLGNQQYQEPNLSFYNPHVIEYLKSNESIF